MKNVGCNDSSLVCYNHFRKCDYKISGERWNLNPGAVPSQFDREFDRNSETVDSMNNDETLECDESGERTETVSEQNKELERLETEKNFWKEECIALSAQLLKTQQKNNELNLVSCDELAKLKVTCDNQSYI